MNDIETTLRAGLKAFAAETTAAASPPSTASISLRARTVSGTRPRWPKIAIAISAGALVTTGVASAAGVLPGPVESMVREFRSWGFETDDTASRMASTADGAFTYELWVARLRGGGLCVFVRVAGPDGDIDHGGNSACGPWVVPSTSEHWNLRYPGRVGNTARSGQKDTANGQLPPGATQVVFELDDGTAHSVHGQNDGWFITTFQGVRHGAKIVSVHALDAAGNVIG